MRAAIVGFVAGAGLLQQQATLPTVACLLAGVVGLLALLVAGPALASLLPLCVRLLQPLPARGRSGWAGWFRWAGFLGRLTAGRSRRAEIPDRLAAGRSRRAEIPDRLAAGRSRWAEIPDKLAAGRSCWARLPDKLAASWSRWAEFSGKLAAVLAGFVAGFLWAAWLAQRALAPSLAQADEGRDLIVVGTIDNLPHRFPQGVRFNFAVERVEDRTGAGIGSASASASVPVPPRIALSWYSDFRDRPAATGGSAASSTVGNVQPGERWRLTVRLQRPHGNANPHGFDYEVWLLEQGIRATGYVRPDHDNRRRDAFVVSAGNLVERSRAALRARIERALDGKPYAGVIVALVVGDQRGIGQADWQVFNRTGIGHLVSISGLHITMVAGLFALAAFTLWRHSFFTGAQLPLLLPAQKVAALVGAVSALLYVLLAGFGVPAQRTLYMLTVVAVALWCNRLSDFSHVLCTALGVVVVIDPWAVLWPGFWLSFGAVAVIVYATAGRIAVRPARLPPGQSMPTKVRSAGPCSTVTAAALHMAQRLRGQAATGAPGATAPKAAPGVQDEASVGAPGATAPKAAPKVQDETAAGMPGAPAMQGLPQVQGETRGSAPVIDAMGATATATAPDLTHAGPLQRAAGQLRAWLQPWWQAVRLGAYTQYAVTLGLLPLTMLLFSQVSVISPVANAVAIPLISLVITPLALVGSVLPAMFGAPLLVLAHGLIAWLAACLTWLSGIDHAVLTAPAPPLWLFCLAMFGTLWLLAPRGWPVRWLGLATWIPLLAAEPDHPDPGRMTVTAFDVGQGMALLVETSSRRLLYDTGPAYGPDSNAGARVIVPYLRTRGIGKLDGMVVSHSDADHAGGALAVLDNIGVGWVLSSLGDSHPVAGVARRHLRCAAGQGWTWDGVRFEILHPLAAQHADAGLKSNGRSCVLRVTAGARSLLLAGDIEAAQEAQLVARMDAGLRADILLAPHHGSGTSSTPAFLQAVAPHTAIFQVGHRNRYRHPQQQVYERYGALGIERLRTDRSGALTLHFGQTVQIDAYRQTSPRYWYDIASASSN
ncbi:DNA internalization-related competence protein ComEC/Rec2 [Duganella sp. Leaf126]|uniref:DNA internalization-related competence protein ComEC/Rec2 n=1 Tax=Duganella sp. Leaf126 TaxID=1736266 RepID=UPI001E605F2C|nr:DNA internalization-related competence protein ComEC/Rec2 [Duganella sp. Leaf126]